MAQHSFSCLQLQVQRRHTTVLKGVDFQLQPNELVGVLGANGAGKSTFLSALCGELTPKALLGTAHAITINQRTLPQLSALAQSRLRAVLPQKPSLSFDLSVDDVIKMGAYPFNELSDAQVEAYYTQAIALAGTQKFVQRSYLRLSGGEQQRVQFTRILLQVLCAVSVHGGTEACYLLLDEPTASLDPYHQNELLRIVQQLSRNHRVGAMVIVHDVNLAARYCDRLALLSDGKILAYGTPQQVLTTENLFALYGVSCTIVPHPSISGCPLVVFGA